MEYLKVKSKYTTCLDGIVKVSEYKVTKCGLYGIILNVVQSIWYSEDSIKIYRYDKNDIFSVCRYELSTVDKIEKITYKEYYDIINQLKERRLIKSVEKPIEPYMVDIENSTNTCIKMIPRPGFEFGKRPYKRLEYFETLGAAYPVTDWIPFVNEPYEVKVDTKRYRGYKFLPDESTLEKSVYKIVWPRKREFKKKEMVWR